VPHETASDKRLELAYEAAQQKLSVQDATLGNVRTRANNLLAAAALFTSFAAGVGLIKTNPGHSAMFSRYVAMALLVVVALLGLSALSVIWPAKGWVFVPSASKIMQMYDSGEDETSIRQFVIAAMIDGGNANSVKLKRKQDAFRVAAALLLAEIVLLLAVLIFNKGGSNGR
jgi:hypothetical protein